MHRSELLGVLLIAAIPMVAIASGLAPDASLEIIFRIVCVFVVLTFAFRGVGKRELSQLSPFELVMLLLIAEIVSPALTAGDESLAGGLIGAMALLVLTFLHSQLQYHSSRFRQATEAPPAVIIRDGRIEEGLLHKERLRPDEIFSEMHKAGIERLEQVKWGILEPDGKMSFVRSDAGETNQTEERAVV